VRSVKRESSRVGEAVKHPHVAADLRHGRVIEHLVEEMAGLLSTSNVHVQLQAVLINDQVGREALADKPLFQRKSLLLANRHIVPQVDPRWLHDLGERLDHHLLPAFHTQREELDREHIIEFVHHQSG
jgi:hypothetical protein